jgi:hypothetical protein
MGGAGMTTYKPGDRVHRIIGGDDHTVIDVDDRGWLLVSGHSWYRDPEAFAHTHQPTRFEPVADEQPGEDYPRFLQDQPLPATAQAILDIGKQPAARVADERGSGVARAVARLSEREPRLGCHAWRP